jgi:hypothetical protein
MAGLSHCFGELKSSWPEAGQGTAIKHWLDRVGWVEGCLKYFLPWNYENRPELALQPTSFILTVQLKGKCPLLRIRASFVSFPAVLK